eukprot:gene7238-biopygen8615
MQLFHLALLLATIFVAFGTFLLSSKTKDANGLNHVQPLVKRILPARNPWDGVPEFVLYLRLTSGLRWEQEYRNDLIRTMNLFFPYERAKLLVVLDNEKDEDHLFGDKIKGEWPYPRVCYRDPSAVDAYRGRGKARMFWDMMYPDECTNVSYVGDAYSWRLQMVPNGDWTGEHLSSSQVSPDYYRSNMPPKMLVPMPRSSIHLR